MPKHIGFKGTHNRRHTHLYGLSSKHFN